MMKYCRKNPIKCLIVGILSFLVIKNSTEGFRRNEYYGFTVDIRTKSNKYISAKLKDGSLSLVSEPTPYETWEVVKIRDAHAFWNRATKKYIRMYDGKVTLSAESEKGKNPGGFISFIIEHRPGMEGGYTIRWNDHKKNRFFAEEGDKIIMGWHHENKLKELDDEKVKPEYKFYISGRPSRIEKMGMKPMSDERFEKIKQEIKKETDMNKLKEQEKKESDMLNYNTTPEIVRNDINKILSVIRERIKELEGEPQKAEETESEVKTAAGATATATESEDQEKDNTMMYLAIGGGVFLLIMIVMMMGGRGTPPPPGY